MAEIDIQVIQNIGLMETVTQMAEHIYEFRKMQEVASASQFQDGHLPDSDGIA